MAETRSQACSTPLPIHVMIEESRLKWFPGPGLIALITTPHPRRMVPEGVSPREQG
jgi:hypothetical protein